MHLKCDLELIRFIRATTDVPLAKLSENLIVSFVYSHDIVSRLSIGTVKDLRNAAMWLCDANVAGGALRESGYAAVTERANKWKAGMGSQDDPDWVRTKYPSFYIQRGLEFLSPVYRYAEDTRSEHATTQKDVSPWSASLGPARQRLASYASFRRVEYWARQTEIVRSS